MNLIGIYGSPRPGGNSDLLLDKALEGAQSAGASIEKIFVRDLSFSGCLECGGCDETGECVLSDQMDGIYPLLRETPVIILASPIFFYGLPSQAKALVDRSQALWMKRALEKTPDQRKHYHHGRGYFIAVGATKGKSLFEGVELTARYFFDALDKSYGGGLFIKNIEKKGAIADHPTALKEAFELGVRAAKEDLS
jgi:multimeric flavodoxin WrbA